MRDGTLYSAMGGAALGAIGGNAAMGAAIGAGVDGGMGMMHQRRAEQQYQQRVQQAGAKNQQTLDLAANTFFTCLAMFPRLAKL